MQPCYTKVSGQYQATVKRVKSLIQGCQPKQPGMGMKRSVLLNILNKRIVTQQRALACQSKAFAHMLQRELYTMGISILIRCAAEMTHLQPHLEQLGFRNLGTTPFGPLLCFWSKLVKEGEEFLLKKDTQKTLRVSDSIKFSPFAAPTAAKEAPMGGIPFQAVTNHFPQVGGN